MNHPYITQQLVDQRRSDMTRAAESWRIGREIEPVQGLFGTKMFWRIRGMFQGRTRWVPEAGLPPIAVA